MVSGQLALRVQLPVGGPQQKLVKAAGFQIDDHLPAHGHGLGVLGYAGAGQHAAHVRAGAEDKADEVGVAAPRRGGHAAQQRAHRIVHQPPAAGAGNAQLPERGLQRGAHEVALGPLHVQLLAQLQNHAVTDARPRAALGGLPREVRDLAEHLVAGDALAARAGHVALFERLHHALAVGVEMHAAGAQIRPAGVEHQHALAADGLGVGADVGRQHVQRRRPSAQPGVHLAQIPFHQLIEGHLFIIHVVVTQESFRCSAHGRRLLYY